jgi:hypothetical protein
VDQPSQQQLRVAANQLPLPFGELNPTLVLPAASVLGEEAWPGFRVRRYLDICVLGGPGEAASSHLSVNRVVWHDVADRGGALIHDAGIAKVENDAEPVDLAPMRRDAAVPEVQPK